MQLRRKFSPPHSDRYNKPLLGWADPDSLTWLIYTCQNNVCLLNSKFKPQTSITYHQRTALDPDRCGWKCYVVTWMHRDSCGDSEDVRCPHYRVVNSSAPEVFLQLEVQTFLASPIKRSLDRAGVHIESWHLLFTYMLNKEGSSSDTSYPKWKEEDVLFPFVCGFLLSHLMETLSAS